jgi:hypothetical protein
MATAYSLNDITCLQNRELFVDANVFILRFYQEERVISGRRKKAYINAYNKVLNEGIPLKTSFDVISEYINRSMRMKQRALQMDDLDFKIFRNSQQGHDALEEIHIILKDKILKQVVIVERPFDNETVEKFLVIDRLDFVDKSIVAICQGKSYVLFSDDGDYKESDIEVLTNNPVFWRE